MARVTKIGNGQVLLLDVAVNGTIDQLYMAGDDRNYNGYNLTGVRTMDTQELYVGGFPITPSQFGAWQEKTCVATGDPRVYTFSASGLNGISVFVNGLKIRKANYVLTGTSAPPQFLNSNFESTALANWAPQAGTFGTPSTNPHGGSYCGSLLTNGAYISQNLSGLINGATYRITVWVRIDPGTTAPLSLQVHDGSGANFSIGVAAVPGLNWSRISIPYTADATGIVTFAIIRGTGTGPVIFDDVSVSGGYGTSTFTVTFAAGSAPAGGSFVEVAGQIIG